MESLLGCFDIADRPLLTHWMKIGHDIRKEGRLAKVVDFGSGAGKLLSTN